MEKEVEAVPEEVSRSTYAGLFLVCLVTLMFEILLTRIFSVIMWYHFAFLAVSVAMFGMTVGAILVYLFPRLFSRRPTHFYLALNSWLLSLSILVTFVIEIYLPVYVPETIRLVSLTYIITLIPFVFSGICVSLVLVRFPRNLSKLYSADLAGAGCGCVLLIYLLKFTDGPTAVIALSAIVSLAAFIFARNAGRTFKRLLLINTVLFFAFAACHTILVKQNRALLRVVWAKEKRQSRPIYERWNSFSRIQVKADKDEDNSQSWGISGSFVPQKKVRELRLNIDASASTVLTNYTGDAKEIEHLKYDVTNLVHHVRHGANVLIVGMGGGRDVLSAIAFDQSKIVGVEINDQILEAVNGRFGDFTGHLYKDPRVQLVNDEARSYIARQENPFDIIQVSLIDTWAATAAGAYALTENSLYTMEAWQMFLRHLSPDGILSFSRWYSPGNSPGLYRLTALATAALKSAGITNPKDHMMIVASNPMQKKKRRFKGVATLLVCKAPFSPQELDEIEATSERLDFDILYSPRGSLDKDLKRIILEQNARLNFDLSPPTDDRPFFFNTLTAPALLKIWKTQSLTSDTNPGAVLLYLFVISFVLTLICIFLPLLLTIRKIPSNMKWRYLLFFAAIGVGFMMIEVSQMQRLAIFLGHPTYSLSVVLFSLLLSSGLGSYFTSRFSEDKISSYGKVCIVALLFSIVVFGMTTVLLIRQFEHTHTAIRILIAGIILVPMGFCMGTAFPLGMRLAAVSLPQMTPWFWGINGAVSVWASIFAVILAILWGISVSFWTGFASYSVAFLAFVWMSRKTSV